MKQLGRSSLFSGFYAALVGFCLPTFRDSLSVPTSRVKLSRNVSKNVCVRTQKSEDINYTAVKTWKLTQANFSSWQPYRIGWDGSVACMRKKRMHTFWNEKTERKKTLGDLEIMFNGQLFFYVWVSVHHNSILYKEPTRCNFGSIV
jgi:hypothetical protein